MAEALGLLLSYKGLTIATAESCTEEISHMKLH